MATTLQSVEPEGRAAVCEWIEPGLREIAGQDPLGLQTITTDRILPALLPGVLALSRRARYFSIYPFLIRRYSNSGGRADNHGLDVFVRHREFELCVAANLCPRCDADGAIGNRVARPLVAARPSKYERQLSVRSELGGYGLYYRSPLEELEIVAIAGRAMLGDQPTPVDLLRPGPRASGLADAFEAVVADTRWYREWMHGVDAVPAEVLEELAETACLCRLDYHPDEREAIGRVLLSTDSTERLEPTEQRRRAFAFLLEQTERYPTVVDSDAAFRAAVLETFLESPQLATPRGSAQAQWAAVVMRECVQDCLATLWLVFCRLGLSSQPFEGFSRPELDELISTRLMGSGQASVGEDTVAATANMRVSEWIAEIRGSASRATWEELRAQGAAADNALTALAAFVELSLRVGDLSPVSQAWLDVARVDGANQPGLLRIGQFVQRMIESELTVAQLLARVIDTFIVRVHETVAMSKLPESTFRFFWEHGRLRFVDNGITRFEPSGLRRDAIASLSNDLGWWWRDEDTAELTPRGRNVIEDVFGP